MRGVYAIRCTDGRAYVGGSINVVERFRNHRTVLKSGKHRNWPLQEAWDRLGATAFTFVLLEAVAEGDELAAAEQRWIDASRAEGGVFNRAPFAGSNTGVVHTPEMRERNAATRRGKPLSAEHRANLAAAARGRVHTAETRAKLSATHLGELAPLAKLTADIVRDIRRRAQAGESQDSISRLYGVSQSTVSRACLRKTWGHVPDDGAAGFRMAELASVTVRRIAA